MLIDSHCHLHMLAGAGIDPDAALAAATEAGVKHFLTVAVDFDSALAAVEFARRHPQVSAAAGIHPSDEAGAEVDIERLTELAAADEVVAVGETGLDYHYNKGDLEWQRQRFREHIAVAREIGKPLIVHTRDARADTVNILREEKADEVGGVIHCFTEDYETAARCLDLGFYISFSGILTFRNADPLREVARRLPLDRMLVETDSPFLAPVPYRGKPNQPAYVGKVAEMLAELKKTSYEEIVDTTGANFYQLFPLAKRPH